MGNNVYDQIRLLENKINQDLEKLRKLKNSIKNNNAKTVKNNPSTYALYQNDQLFAVGTLEELSKNTGLSPNTLYQYTLSSYLQKHKNEDGTRLIKIEGDHS